VKALALAAVLDVEEEDALVVAVVAVVLLTVTSASLVEQVLVMVVALVDRQHLHMAAVSGVPHKQPMAVLLTAEAMVAAMATQVAQVVSLPGGRHGLVIGANLLPLDSVTGIETKASSGINGLIYWAYSTVSLHNGFWFAVR
jgi:hypothetical protein